MSLLCSAARREPLDEIETTAAAISAIVVSVCSSEPGFVDSDGMERSHPSVHRVITDANVCP